MSEVLLFLSVMGVLSSLGLKTEPSNDPNSPVTALNGTRGPLGRRLHSSNRRIGRFANYEARGLHVEKS